MGARSKHTTAALLLAVWVGSAGAASAEEQERSLAEALQSRLIEFDPSTQEPTVAFQGDAGALRPGVRCATRPIGDLEAPLIESAIGERLRVSGTAHRARQLEIPVQVTILRTKAGKYDLTDQQVNDQIDILNQAFAPHGFSFRLAGIERRDKTKLAKRCLRPHIEERLKERFAVDPSTTLNIYSCRLASGVLGYARFPFDLPEDSTLQGVVLLHSVFPGGSAVPYHLGDTAVHEVGHYLGLFHTFQGGCARKGDRIGDTPREQTAARGCEIGRDTCSQTGLDPVTNYMDYSDDACVEEFTAKQAERMKDQTATFRPSLGN